MSEFDAADVSRYYDRHTDDFVAHGQGGAVGALHRAVWAPGIEREADAFRYIEERIGAATAELSTTCEPPTVLDLGCGVGASLCYLAERHPIRGIGLPVSPVQGAHARRRIDACGLGDRLQCIEADFLRPPDSLPPVDLAYAIESFVHTPDPSAFFATCARLIRPGGRLLICDDFRRPTPSPQAVGTVERFRRGWPLNSLVDGNELVRLADAGGFGHERTHELTPHLRLGRPRDRLIALFIALFGWLPLDGTRAGHLVGGNALHTCLSKGWIGYDLAYFRRRA